MLCLSFPPALPAPGCLCLGRAVGTMRMTRDGDTSAHVLTQCSQVKGVLKTL